MLVQHVDVAAVHAAGVDMQRLPQSSSTVSGAPVSIPRIDVAALSSTC